MYLKVAYSCIYISLNVNLFRAKKTNFFETNSYAGNSRYGPDHLQIG